MGHGVISFRLFFLKVSQTLFGPWAMLFLGIHNAVKVHIYTYKGDGNPI